VSFFIGVELGQVSDVTAIAVVESLTLTYLRTDRLQKGRWVDLRPVYRTLDGKETYDHPPVDFALRHLERILPGTGYPEIVSRVKALHCWLKSPTVILDASGVGRAAVELFRDTGFSIYSLTLTAGDQTTNEGSSYRVPKRDVISSTQILLQTGRLKIARALPHARLLARELVNFHFTVGREKGDETLDWREGPDDDLVLALAIAAWEAERNPGLGFSMSYGVSEFSGPRLF
jgi:hypothetical protein